MSLEFTCSHRKRNDAHPEKAKTARKARKRRHKVKHYKRFVTHAQSVLLDWASNSTGLGPLPSVLVSDTEYNIFDLATSYPYLRYSADLIRPHGQTPGVDGIQYTDLFRIPDPRGIYYSELRTKLRAGLYSPNALRPVSIPKSSGKVRLLQIPTLEDRMVDKAISIALMPLYEPGFHENSFGFRPGLSIRHAIMRFDEFVRENQTYVACPVDLRDAFDSIPHKLIMDLLKPRVQNENLLALISKIIGRPSWANKYGEKNRGIPQGSPLSPILMNIVMDTIFDKSGICEKRNVHFVRYADDILLLSRTPEDITRCIDDIIAEFSRHSLELKPDMEISPDIRTQSLEWLGYTLNIEDGVLKPSLTLDTITNLREALIDIEMDRGRKDKKYDLRNYNAKQKELAHHAEYIIRGFLQHYAICIPENENSASEVIAAIKRVMLEAKIDMLPSKTIRDIITASQIRWKMDFILGIPSLDKRLSHIMLQRGAPATQISRKQSPDDLASGLDIVPPPDYCYVKQYEDRKPHYNEPDWQIAYSEY